MANDNRMERIREAAAVITSRVEENPTVGLILGSGLGVLGDEVEAAVRIPYEEIPHFPVSTVEGHAGQLVVGHFEGHSVVVMQGRFHYYEGYSMDEVVFPMRVMKALGVDSVVVTNAAGGVNESFSAGELMLIHDHINTIGVSPLRGTNLEEFGPRFPDMSSAYTPALRKMAHKVADEAGITVREGVYALMSGPNYETPAEIRFLRVIGADAVGMSTVPEVTVAAHAGLRVVGVSAITNMAAGILDQPLNHAEVVEVGLRVRVDFERLIRGIVARL